MGVVRACPFEFHPLSTDALLGSLAHHTRPACIEETFVRGGTVHFLASFFGLGWAYLGGSVLFALMHLGNPWFTYEHLVCISAAGLMLSTVYIEYGLLAAIGVHFAWNVLSWYLIVSLQWKEVGGLAALEGDWTTTLIMLIATLAVVVVSRRHKPTQHAAAQPLTNEETIA